MPKASTLVLRKLSRKVKAVDTQGEIRYASWTPDGAIIDLRYDDGPINLERQVLHRNNRVPTWEVVEKYANWERALPAAKAFKTGQAPTMQMLRSWGRERQVLRLRNTQTNDIIMVDIL